MIKINIYGCPGSGKSTFSAMVYSEMKLRRKKVELVREFAKDLVYEGKDMLKLSHEERLFLLAEQVRREWVLNGKVNYLITDSPLLLTAYYHKNPHVEGLVKDMVNIKKEKHFFLYKDSGTEFENYGRSHNEHQATKIEKDMEKYLSKCGVEFVKLVGSPREKLAIALKSLRMSQKSLCLVDELVKDLE